MAINAYPLHWPEGWPRTENWKRGRAKFGRGERRHIEGGGSYLDKKQLTINDGVTRVLESLQRLGARRDDIVVSSNIPLRMDGMPRSDARNPEDPGVAVYWETKKKGVQVMAIDQYDRAADNLAAIAATLEAMRAIERHGGAQILERAFTGFQALPSPDQAGGMRWQDVLEIDAQRAYTLDDCEQQYRRLRSAAHPDKPGGSAEKFNLLQHAIEQARNHFAQKKV